MSIIQQVVGTSWKHLWHGAVARSLGSPSSLLFDGQSSIPLMCEDYYSRVASGGNSSCGTLMATKRFNAEQLRYFHSSGVYNQKNQSQPNKKTKRQGRNHGRLSYRFVDRTRVRVSGGSGGKGSTSMLRIGRKMARRPDGGHGGSGANYYSYLTSNLPSLCITFKTSSR